MNEAETRAELIDPALHAAGWGVVSDSRTRREVIAPGRIMGGGRRAKPLSCDYVLVYRNTKLATIEAKASDLFDVLRYIAFTRAPLKRAERAAARRETILSRYDAKEAEFLDFVLSQYVVEGEGELASEKLPALLELRYGSPGDAVRRLGSVKDIRHAFKGFQKGLYEKDG